MSFGSIVSEYKKEQVFNNKNIYSSEKSCIVKENKHLNILKVEELVIRNQSELKRGYQRYKSYRQIMEEEKKKELRQFDNIDIIEMYNLMSNLGYGGIQIYFYFNIEETVLKYFTDKFNKLFGCSYFRIDSSCPVSILIFLPEKAIRFMRPDLRVSCIDLETLSSIYNKIISESIGRFKGSKYQGKEWIPIADLILLYMLGVSYYSVKWKFLGSSGSKHKFLGEIY